MSLILIQNDGQLEQHRRVGRFAIEREEAASQQHLHAAIQRFQEKMVAGLAHHGYAFADHHGFELRGPLPHLFLSDDSIDAGYANKPDAHDLDATLRWERAERSRVARKVEQRPKDMVDYELVGTFLKRMPRTFVEAARNGFQHIPDNLAYLVGRH